MNISPTITRGHDFIKRVIAVKFSLFDIKEDLFPQYIAPEDVTLKYNVTRLHIYDMGDVADII